MSGCWLGQEPCSGLSKMMSAALVGSKCQVLVKSVDILILHGNHIYHQWLVIAQTIEFSGFLTLVFSQYRSCGSTSSSSAGEPVAASSDCSWLENGLAADSQTRKPNQAVPERCPKTARPEELILQPKLCCRGKLALCSLSNELERFSFAPKSLNKLWSFQPPSPGWSTVFTDPLVG